MHMDVIQEEKEEEKKKKIKNSRRLVHEIETIESKVVCTPKNRNHVRDSWWYLTRRLADHM